jgi:hypothetical protein
MTKVKAEYLDIALELLRRIGLGLDICGSTGKITIVTDNYELNASGSVTKLPSLQMRGQGNQFEVLADGVDISHHLASVTATAAHGQPPTIHCRLAPIAWNLNVD